MKSPSDSRFLRIIPGLRPPAKHRQQMLDGSPLVDYRPAARLKTASRQGWLQPIGFQTVRRFVDAKPKYLVGCTSKSCVHFQEVCFVALGVIKHIEVVRTGKARSPAELTDWIDQAIGQLHRPDPQRKTLELAVHQKGPGIHQFAALPDRKSV